VIQIFVDTYDVGLTYFSTDELKKQYKFQKFNYFGFPQQIPVNEIYEMMLKKKINNNKKKKKSKIVNRQIVLPHENYQQLQKKEPI
jgi:hypothetical protein